MTYLQYWEQPGGLESAQSLVSACRSLDDYNPFKYRDWAHSADRQATPQPAYCRQTCGAVDGQGRLSLDCIDCDPLPLVREDGGTGRQTDRHRRALLLTPVCTSL